VIPRIALAWLAVLLAVPLATGRDEPKKDEPKKDEKPATAKEQYTALVKEFNAERQKLIPEINKAKGEEQQKLLDKYYGAGKEYAGKFLKLAEDNPKDPVATDALFWVLQNGGTESKKAEAKVVGLIADMKLADLRRSVTPLFTAPAARRGGGGRAGRKGGEGSAGAGRTRLAGHHPVAVAEGGRDHEGGHRPAGREVP
jgi:vacuolar-type H+-ATPase subunit H